MGLKEMQERDREINPAEKYEGVKQTLIQLESDIKGYMNVGGDLTNRVVYGDNREMRRFFDDGRIDDIASKASSNPAYALAAERERAERNSIKFTETTDVARIMEGVCSVASELKEPVKISINNIQLIIHPGMDASEAIDTYKNQAFQAHHSDGQEVYSIKQYNVPIYDYSNMAALAKLEQKTTEFKYDYNGIAIKVLCEPTDGPFDVGRKAQQAYQASF